MPSAPVYKKTKRSASPSWIAHGLSFGRTGKICKRCPVLDNRHSAGIHSTVIEITPKVRGDWDDGGAGAEEPRLEVCVVATNEATDDGQPLSKKIFRRGADEILEPKHERDRVPLTRLHELALRIKGDVRCQHDVRTDVLNELRAQAPIFTLLPETLDVPVFVERLPQIDRTEEERGAAAWGNRTPERSPVCRRAKRTTSE